MGRVSASSLQISSSLNTYLESRLFCDRLSHSCALIYGDFSAFTREASVKSSYSTSLRTALRTDLSGMNVQKAHQKKNEKYLKSGGCATATYRY